MRKHMPVVAAVLIIVIVSAACAVSAAPTTAPEDTISTIIAGTMAALTPQATDTSAAPTETLIPLELPTIAPTFVVPTSIPTQLPPVYATISVPNATRINFLAGATSAVLTGPISAGQALNYVLQAAQGQPMLVNVDSLNHDVTLSIRTQGGTTMLNAASGQSGWQGSLPATEDYYLTLHGGASDENFTFTITIPSRIKFLPGDTQAKFNGKTVAGYNVTYVAFAIKGQKMQLDLNNLSGNAALTVYGFADGQPYLNANMHQQTSFGMTLPATQDYIIAVVPEAGSVVSYQLVVKIQ